MNEIKAVRDEKERKYRGAKNELENQA